MALAVLIGAVVLAIGLIFSWSSSEWHASYYAYAMELVSAVVVCIDQAAQRILTQGV